MDEAKKIFTTMVNQDTGPADSDTQANSPLIEVGVRELLLIAKNSDFRTILNFHFEPMGYKVTYTDDPLTIITRFEHLDKAGKQFPEVIIFNTIDFPRHWKPLLKVVREKKSHEECLFILMVGADFHFDEAAKAAFLEVNAILVEDFYKKNAVSQLCEIIKRYKSIDDKRKYIRYIPRQSERFKFLFTHPVKKYLVSGSITDISLAGACLQPSKPVLVADLKVNQVLNMCSLRVAEDILTVNCRIAYLRRELGLEFESLESKGHQKLFHYLMEIPKRAMEARI